MREEMGAVPFPRLRVATIDRTRAALLAVLGAGIGLRVLAMVAWSPAFMGWPDAKSYLDVAHGELFSNVLRPAGYPLFVRALDGLWPSVSLLVVANHALGLAAAGLLYATVRRAGAPPLAALVPAAVVALNGDTVFLEHSPLSEPLFMFLTALAGYAALRALEDTGPAWPVVIGVTLAYATTVRVVGLVLLPVFGLWLLRYRWRAAVIAGATALALLGAYLGAEYAALGAFARTAILHQPLDYLGEVGGDLLRYVAPEHLRRFGGGPSYADLVGEPILANPLYESQGLASTAAYYGQDAFYADASALRALRRYEAATRLQGPVFVLLAVLSLMAPFTLRGRARAAAVLFGLTGWALLVLPVATLEFSGRTAIPGFGPLAAAAALGACGLASRRWSR